jgi:hypothetical protein
MVKLLNASWKWSIMEVEYGEGREWNNWKREREREREREISAIINQI